MRSSSIRQSGSRWLGSRPRAIVEACEARRMLVTYQVTGTAGDDAISISISGNSIISVVNGNSDSASDIINNTIEITGLGGHDTISITETGNNVVIVNAGSGNDTINVGNGGNNLNNIDDNVTINGESGDDQTIFHDSANAVAENYTSSVGNRLSTTAMPQATINTERVRVNAGAGTSNMIFNDPPSADYLFTGGGGSNVAFINGLASESVTYRTGGQSGGSGLIDFPVVNTTAELFSTASLIVNEVGHVTMRPSFLGNDFTVNSTLIGSTISGVSGIAAPPTNLLLNDNVATCTIDYSQSENATSVDVLRFTGDSDGGTLFEVDLGGLGGGNSIFVDGDHKINTRFGFAGGQFNDIVITGATASFQGLQTPKSLTVRSNGTAAFTGTGQVLATPSLQVPLGVGNVNVNTAQTGVVASAFAVGTNAEFVKKGGGTLTVNSSVVQSHAATAIITGGGGTLSINNDVGAALSRKTNLTARSGGVLLLNSNQHVRSLFADAGTIRLGTFGTRVIVTDTIAVNTDTGGAIDLTNNNLVYEYSGANQVNVIRDLLVGGYAGGAWNGIGLSSSQAVADTRTALGYAESTELFTSFPATFAGESIDSTSVVVRHTFYGDTNLDRNVNFDDLLRIAQNYAPTVGGKSWARGNSNYNTPDNVASAVGFDDLLLMAQNYNLFAVTVTGGRGRDGAASDILE